MVTLDELKHLLPQIKSHKDKLILVMSTSNSPWQLTELKKVSADAGYKWPTKFNPSRDLGRTQGKAIRTTAGWELTNVGREYSASLAGNKKNGTLRSAAADLAAHAENISSPQIRGFVAEAISCLNEGHIRSAIVMSWLGAVAILQDAVVAGPLADFNTEASRRDPKWKHAKNSDDLSRLKEREFLDILSSISMIGINVKKELVSCLDRRNGCGHPNSLVVKEATAAHHLEVLILNVYSKF